MVPAPGTKAARNLAFVEVRKNADSTNWYHAQLLDVCAGKALVSFEDGVWADREVPYVSVRPRPAEDTPPLESVPPLGTNVEVLVDPSPKSPMGWAFGTVIAVAGKGNAAVVRIGQKDYTVSLEALRQASKQQTLDPFSTVRRAALVPEELRGWLLTEDARGCCEQIRQTASLGLAGAGSSTGGILLRGDQACAGDPNCLKDSAPNAVLLIGEEEATRRGEMLVRVHLMHQQAVEAYHTRRLKKTELLRNLQNKALGTDAPARTSFEVEPTLVGKTVGAGGQNVKRVSAKFNVEIRILDGPGESEPRKIIILGSSEVEVTRAREEFEVVKRDYNVAEECVGWLVSHMSGISKSTGLVYGKWTGCALELCGTKSQIYDAEMLLDNHKEYFGVFEEMSQQRNEISRSFEALDEAAVAAGISPPPGKGKGRDRRSSDIPAFDFAGSSRGSGRVKGGRPEAAAVPGRGGPASETEVSLAGRASRRVPSDRGNGATDPSAQAEAGKPSRGRGRGRGRAA